MREIKGATLPDVSLPMPAFDSTDTLAQKIAPPVNEPPDARKVRTAQEAQALEKSRRIDAEIRARKIAMKKKPPVKVLVLGQSESGKTTTIKNFQMTYAHQAWTQERIAWRPIIYLNLVRSINYVITIITPELDSASEVTGRPFALTYQHQILLLRLGPIRQTQKTLESLLGSGTGSIKLQARSEHLYSTVRPADRKPVTALSEITIPSHTGWKGVLNSVERSGNSPPSSASSSRRKYSHPVEEVSELLLSCKDDIIRLWADKEVQALLAFLNVRLKDSPGFFLDDVERIASRGYEPSDEDIVRARLRTLGVQEYRFSLDTDSYSKTEWIMYDVAGCRTQRAAWVPYFTDVTAIIFLAPISSFDEWLTEDYRVNRLQDTFMLWQTLCKSRLLTNTQIILFMNKCDLLANKLKDGRIKVRDYIVDFGDRPNNFKTVTSFFHQAFKSICKKDSPEERRLYSHFTSVVDTKSTALTLVGVQESILRRHFSNAGLI